MDTHRRAGAVPRSAGGGRNAIGGINAYMTPLSQQLMRRDNIGGAAGQSHARYGSPEIGGQYGKTGWGSPILLGSAHRQDPQSRNLPSRGRGNCLSGERDGNAKRGGGEPMDYEWEGCKQDLKEVKESCKGNIPDGSKEGLLLVGGTPIGQEGEIELNAPRDRRNGDRKITKKSPEKKGENGTLLPAQ